MTPAPKEHYEFAGFRVDPARRLVSQGGQPVALTPKALDLLLALLERRHVVVTKDELMALVWPDTIVEENNLTVTMSALRKALGDHPGQHRVIATIPGRGYRFVAALSGGPEPAGGPQPRKGDLPEALSSFIGREQEIAEISRLLTASRLVTLTGSGGCGKTRLAVEIARRLANDMADGVWMVELAPLSDSALVPQVAASVLGIREEAGRAVESTLIETLRGKSMLLVLDNCEHLIDACARLAHALLSRSRGVRILATSREPLAATGEAIWRVPSLTLPSNAEEAAAATAVDASDAVRLFVARASAILPSFRLSDRNASSVAGICRRLDGIPLAIELAAARIEVLTVEQIADRLDDQFRLLSGGPRSSVPRHRTLRASMDWSHALLAPAEQQLFRRLSVFLGGWTLEAAEAVAVDEGGDARDVLDLVASLVSKSLLAAEYQVANRPDDSIRYHMLETVRQYGREQLTDAGEEDLVRRRHLLHFLALAERAEPELFGADATAWLDRLSAEHDNLRTALDWALGREDESGLRLAAALCAFWSWRGHLAEGGTRIDRALERAGQQGTAHARARAHNAAAMIAFFRGNLGEMARHSRQSLSIARELGDIHLVAYSLLLLAGYHLYEEVDHDRAGAMLEESLGLARQTGDRFLVALVLINLGFPAILRGALTDAEAWLSEGRTLAQETGNPWIVAGAKLNVGLLQLSHGNAGEANELCHESLVLRSQTGDRWGMIQSVEALANVAMAQGNAERAACLLGVSAGMSLAIGASVPAFARAAHERAEFTARAALGEARFTSAWSAGRDLSIDQVVALTA